MLALGAGVATGFPALPRGARIVPKPHRPRKRGGL